jgi:hypothetical protein
MKLFKRVLVMVVLEAGVLASQAEVGTQSFGITNSIAANGTTSENLGSGIKVDNHDSVGGGAEVPG